MRELQQQDWTFNISVSYDRQRLANILSKLKEAAQPNGFFLLDHQIKFDGDNEPEQVDQDMV